ncbi:MAG TPA: ferrochelatase, partial [Saprospiraceae bacterium]|nr:ferrochelatase [Saprospiraceae bacterium]
HCHCNIECCQKITNENKFCYSAQCYATTKALVVNLGLKEWQYTTCFQSRLGRDPWIKPYTSDVLLERTKKGDKSLLVFCPAFVSDCLETTVEVEDEYRNDFIHLGGEKLDLVESLNDNPEWIKVVAEFIKQQN